MQNPPKRMAGVLERLAYEFAAHPDQRPWPPTVPPRNLSRVSARSAYSGMPRSHGRKLWRLRPATNERCPTPLPATSQTTEQTSSCQSRISWSRQPDFNLFRPPGRIRERSCDVFGLKIRVIGENVLVGSATGEQIDNRAHRHAHSSDARLAAHHVRIQSNAVEWRHGAVRREFEKRSSRGPKRTGLLTRTGSFDRERENIRAHARGGLR